jgi:hypothetical protein
MANMSKEQIKAAITEAGFKLTDLFSEEEIVASEPAKKAKQTEYEWAKRLETKLGEAREENSKLQGENQKLKGDQALLLEKANAGTSKELLSTIATERKLDPKFTAYVEKNIKHFKSSKTGDELKEDIGKFIDAQAKEYTEMGKSYGFEAKITTAQQQSQDDKSKSGGSGTPAADGKTGSEDASGDEGASPYEDPKKNEFIPA